MFVPSVGIPVWTALIIALFALGAGVLFYRLQTANSAIDDKSITRSPFYAIAVFGLMAFALLLLVNASSREDARNEALTSFERDHGVTIIHLNGLFPIDEDQTVPVIVENGGRLYDGLITTRGGRYDLKLVNNDYYPYPYAYPMMESPQVYEDDYAGKGDSYVPDGLEEFIPQDMPDDSSGGPFEGDTQDPRVSDSSTLWGE